MSVAITGPSTDGRYHGFLQVGVKPNGKPDRRHRSGRTYTDVEDKLRKLEMEYDTGKVAKAGKELTVEAWFEQWLTSIAPMPQGRRAGLSRNTLRLYRGVCRTWLYPQVGSIRLNALEPEHLDRVYAAMYKAGRAPGTVANAHTVIRRGLEIAVRRRHLDRNVAKLMDAPGRSSGDIVALTTDEVGAVLGVVTAQPDAARWLFGLATGARQGEVLGLRWPYVDMDAGTVEIAWQLQRYEWRHGCDDPRACGKHHFEPCPGRGPRHRNHGEKKGQARPCPPPCRRDCDKHAAACPEREGGGLQFVETKSKKSRVVAVPEELVALLREVRSAQRRDRLAAGPLWADHDVVFCGPLGRLVDPIEDRARWAGLLADAGVPPARLHAMRHTAATMLVRMQEDLSIVQQILGHVNIQVTRRYVDVSTEMTRPAAKKMGRALFGSATRRATSGAGD